MKKPQQRTKWIPTTTAPYLEIRMWGFLFGGRFVKEGSITFEQATDIFKGEGVSHVRF